MEKKSLKSSRSFILKAKNYCDFFKKTLNSILFTHIMTTLLNTTSFSFNNYKTFVKLDLLTNLISISKAYANIDPIDDGSISIKYSGEEASFLLLKGDHLMMEMLQSGTKIFDALSYIAARGDESLKDVFVLTKVNDKALSKQVRAIKIAVSCIIIFVSRGALPGISEKSASTKLPRFVTNLLGQENMETEGNLRAEAMSFDPKHVNLDNFFSAENLEGWDSILANRFNLGVAGHKPLKVVYDLYSHFSLEELRSPADHLVHMLFGLASDGSGDCYPTLHPSKQIVSTKFKDFYKQCLCAIYDTIVEDDPDQKIKIMKTCNALTPDKWITKENLTMHKRVYRNWDLKVLKNTIGKPVIFLSRTSEVPKEELTVSTSKSSIPVAKAPRT